MGHTQLNGHCFYYDVYAIQFMLYDYEQLVLDETEVQRKCHSLEIMHREPYGCPVRA